MSKEKFTQGPWKADWKEHPILFPFIWQENGYAIAKMCGKPNEQLAGTTIPVGSLADYAEPEKVLANAALIAAAPELYYALKNLKECLESYFGKTEKSFFEDCEPEDDELFFAREYTDACNALEKARGER